MPNPSILRRGLAIVSALLLGALGAGAADAEIARNCRDIPLPSLPTLPVDALPFRALTVKHLQTVTVDAAPVDGKFLQAPIERGGRFNESEGGAIVAVVTKRHRPAKLVLTVSERELIVRELTTFSVDGEIVVRRTDLRLTEGHRIDLDRGSIVTGTGETDLRWGQREGRLTLSPANGARLAVLMPRIAIPVTAHFMTRRGSTFDPGSFMPLATLQELFAPEGKINRIWKPAGLLFVVSQAEACAYSVRDFLPERSEPEADGVPAPSEDCRSLFGRISTVHNSPINAASRLPTDAEPAYGADLYLWMAVGWEESNRLFGYGAQHRAAGPNHGPGAIWMNAVHCRTAGPGCAPRLAHEIGHFLGLCHACLTEVTAPSERGLCGFCTNVRACAAGQSNLLMRDDAAGEHLTPGEVGQARQKAVEHRWRGITRAGSP